VALGGGQREVTSHKKWTPVWWPHGEPSKYKATQFFVIWIAISKEAYMCNYSENSEDHSISLIEIIRPVPAPALGQYVTRGVISIEIQMIKKNKTPGVS
jgi:hypothetical protein